MAIGGIYSEKSGITNLAIEGLQGFGAFTGALAAVLVAGSFSGNSVMPFYIAMLFAVIGGTRGYQYPRHGDDFFPDKTDQCRGFWRCFG